MPGEQPPGERQGEEGDHRGVPVQVGAGIHGRARLVGRHQRGDHQPGGPRAQQDARRPTRPEPTENRDQDGGGRGEHRHRHVDHAAPVGDGEVADGQRPRVQVVVHLDMTEYGEHRRHGDPAEGEQATGPGSRHASACRRGHPKRIRDRHRHRSPGGPLEGAPSGAAVAAAATTAAAPGASGGQSTGTSARALRAPIAVIAQPAAAKPTAAAPAISAIRQADWVSAVPPRCPTSVPYVAQPAAAAAS